MPAGKIDERATGTPYDRMIRAAFVRMCDLGPPPTIAATAKAASVAEPLAGQLFADEDALSAAVVENVLVQMTGTIGQQTAASAGADPEAQYRSLMDALIGWVLHNPDQSQVLLHQHLLHHCRPGYSRYGEALQAMAIAILRRAGAEGRLAAAVTPEDAEFASRALIQGLMRLSVPDGDDPGQPPRANAERVGRMCRAAVDHLLRGIFVSPPQGA